MGLVTGDPAQPVRRVLLAVDPVQAVIDEAVAWEADLLVTHHPLLLRGVHSVAATHPKGRAVAALVRAGVALQVAHTNADVADPGVSDALAAALGLADLRPLRPSPTEPLDKLVTFVPAADADRVVDALAAAGAGRLGDYARCAFTSTGTGTFTPLPGASPTIGVVGRPEQVVETRVEMVLARHRRTDVVAALRAAHPYEEPAFDLLEQVALPGRRGTGRVGTWSGGTLRDLAGRAAQVLPATAAACASAATSAARCGRWRSAGERATTCSTTCARPTWTPSSRPTCATTRRRRPSSTAGRGWSTSATGPASGPGWPTASDCSAAGSAPGRIRW